MRKAESFVTVEEVFQRKISAAATEKEATRVLFEATARHSEAQQSGLWRRAFDLKDGSIATLLVPLKGRRVLVLPGEWGTRSRVLAHFGARVWHVDPSEGRVRFSRLLAGDRPITHIKDSCALPLPFRDAAFDLALMRFDDLVGIHVAEARVPRPTTQLRKYLSEIQRVLVPGGQLVLDIPNRWSYQRLDPATALAKDSASLSLASCMRVVRSAGFNLRVVMAPWPSRHDWRWLVSLEGLHQQALTGAGFGFQGGSFRYRIRRLLQKLHLLKYVAPGYLLLASKKEPIAEQTGEDLGARLRSNKETRSPPAIRRSSAHNTPTLHSGTEFIKVGLDARANQKVEQEVRNTWAARRSSFRPFVIEEVALKYSHGLVLARFPFIEHDSTISHERRIDEVAAVLRGIERTDRRLDETDLWALLHDTRVEQAATLLNAIDLLRQLHDRADLRLPTGPVHGDLHLDNLLMQPDGRLTIVDWHSFLQHSPLFLDMAQVAMLHAVNCLGARISDALRGFVTGQLRSRFAVEARSLMGELDPASAGVMLISQHWLHGLSEYHPRIDKFRAEIAVVRDCLRTGW